MKRRRKRKTPSRVNAKAKAALKQLRSFIAKCEKVAGRTKRKKPRKARKAHKRKTTHRRKRRTTKRRRDPKWYERKPRTRHRKAAKLGHKRHPVWRKAKRRGKKKATRDPRRYHVIGRRRGAAGPWYTGYRDPE